MDRALAAAETLFPGASFDAVEQLRGGSDRSRVWRVRVVTGADEQRVVVKAFSGTGESWLREVAGLAVLPATAPAPRLLGVGADPQFVVITDIGAGPSVADRLLAADPDAAAVAVRDWGISLAHLHRDTLTVRTAFETQLADRAGELPIAAHPLPSDVEDAMYALDSRCRALQLRVSSGGLAELQALSQRLGAAGPAALTPADACPDNNVYNDRRRLVLIDFEGAQWRHIAWDVAYLRVPWPSCWCCWRLPDRVAEAAIEAYRAELADALPYVAKEQFERDLAAATVGWAIVSTARLLGSALGDDPPPSAGKVAPPRRAMILDRLAAAAESAELPALGELAGALRERLVQRWGELTLELAPAFR